MQTLPPVKKDEPTERHSRQKCGAGARPAALQDTPQARPRPQAERTAPPDPRRTSHNHAPENRSPHGGTGGGQHSQQQLTKHPRPDIRAAAQKLPPVKVESAANLYRPQLLCYPPIQPLCTQPAYTGVGAKPSGATVWQSHTVASRHSGRDMSEADEAQRSSARRSEA